MNELTAYFDRQRQIEADMNFRHPWFNMVYNYIMAVAFIALAVSLVIWAVDVRTERRAEAMTATALASYQAEQDAIRTAEAEQLAAERASEEYVMKKEAEAVAKAFYGIRLFIERYRYTEADLETYARCMFNRAEASGATLQSVISRPDQFTGYSDNNLVLDVYYQMALKFVETWHNETVKPCDIKNQFAELRDDGIWLIPDINVDGYVRRWHA